VPSREDWQRRLGPLYGGAVALVHSTPWRWPTEVGDDARSPMWIVALGLPVGLVAWVVAALAKGVGLPPYIAALLGLAMLTIASAAIIERGLAERIDHWQGHEQGVWRSPGVGAVLVLVFVTLLRGAAILTVHQDRWIWVFLAAAVIGRWAAIFLQALGDPITSADRRRSLVGTPSPAWLTAAISAGVLALAILAIGKIGIVALALAAIVAFALGLEAQRRDGGLSGPAVATAAAVGELLFLLIATIGH
jgi:cobalamin synthase